MSDETRAKNRSFGNAYNSMVAGARGNSQETRLGKGVGVYKSNTEHDSLEVALVVKNPPVKAGDARDSGLIPGWGRSTRGGNGNPLQYSCLGNPMDRGL